MLDTLSVARELTAGGFDRDQAAVIVNAMQKLANQGDHVTSDQLKAGLAEVRTEIAEVRSETAVVRTEVAALDKRLSTQIAELRAEQQTGLAGVRAEIAEVRTEIAEVRTEIANLETRLVRWMVGTILATATLTVGVLRLFG